MADKTWTVIELGGKQHLVTVGSRVVVNRLENKEGETLNLKGLVDELPVAVKVTAHSFGPKIDGLKFKNKVRYLKRYGHKQPQSVVEIVSVGGTAKTEKSGSAEKTQKSPKPKAKAAK